MRPGDDLRPARRLVLAAIVLACVLTVACGTGDSPLSSASTTTLPGDPPTVRIHDFDFVPSEIRVKVGQSVTWVNEDEVEHWVVSLDPNVLDSGRMSNAQTFSFTFTRAGEYRYYCNIHNYMKGTVLVQ